MFSGLIGHQGRVAELIRDPRGGARLVVEAADAIALGVEVKDSVAVNGACLTVVAVDARTAAFDVVPETLARTGLGALGLGDDVNLELSLRLGDRLGGHLVYGHVDALAPIVAKDTEGQGFRLTVGLPPSLAPFIVEKGYVALDGVSLTIASVANDRFTIALIPETAKRTTLGVKGAGDALNVEIDPIARYALGGAAAYAKPSAPSAEEIAWAFEI